MLNKGGPLIELLSLLGTWEQAESLLTKKMTHPGKCRVKDPVSQFRKTPDGCFVMEIERR